MYDPVYDRLSFTSHDLWTWWLCRRFKPQIFQAQKSLEALREYERKKKALQKQNETPEQRETRLQKRREQEAARKASLSQEELSQELKATRERVAAVRANKTPQQKAQDKEAAKSRMADQRARETEQQRQQRLQHMREHNAEVRVAHLTKSQWIRGAFKYDKNYSYFDDKAVSIGEMNKVCKYETCKAKLFYNMDTKSGEPEGICCKNGKVPNLTPKAPPEPLRTLLQDSSKEAKDFRKLSRAYNSAFQMTSFGAGKIIREGNFMPTY